MQENLKMRDLQKESVTKQGRSHYSRLSRTLLLLEIDCEAKESLGIVSLPILIRIITLIKKHVTLALPRINNNNHPPQGNKDAIFQELNACCLGDLYVDLDGQ
jgi:hypothetical protein